MVVKNMYGFKNHSICTRCLFILFFEISYRVQRQKTKCACPATTKQTNNKSMSEMELIYMLLRSTRAKENRVIDQILI